MKPTAELEQAARSAAETFRTENDLGVAPIGDLVTLIEQTHGVDVTVLPIDDKDEHGLTMVDPVRRVTIIAVASSDHPMRWRSNLAHELGHVVFGDHETGEPGVLHHDASAEQRATSFARHLLIPREGIQRLLDMRGARPAARMATRTPSFLSAVVQHFQVSPAMAARQLLEMHLVDQATHDEWSSLSTETLAARFGWADQYATWQAESRQRRAPQRLLARAVAGYTAGILSLEAVASVRGIHPDLLAAEFAAAHIQPASPSEAEKETHLPTVDPTTVDLSWLNDE